MTDSPSQSAASVHENRPAQEAHKAGKIYKVRTCVACRKRAARDTLLRVVLQDDQLIADERAVLPGRGAWVHPTRKCLTTAVTRRLFLRALRASGTPDATPLENRLETAMDN